MPVANESRIAEARGHASAASPSARGSHGATRSAASAAASIPRTNGAGTAVHGASRAAAKARADPSGHGTRPIHAAAAHARAPARRRARRGPAAGSGAATGPASAHAAHCQPAVRSSARMAAFLPLLSVVGPMRRGPDGRVAVRAGAGAAAQIVEQDRVDTPGEPAHRLRPAARRGRRGTSSKRRRGRRRASPARRTMASAPDRRDDEHASIKAAARRCCPRFAAASGCCPTPTQRPPVHEQPSPVAGPYAADKPECGLGMRGEPPDSRSAPVIVGQSCVRDFRDRRALLHVRLELTDARPHPRQSPILAACRGAPVRASRASPAARGRRSLHHVRISAWRAAFLLIACTVLAALAQLAPKSESVDPASTRPRRSSTRSCSLPAWVPAITSSISVGRRPAGDRRRREVQGGGARRRHSPMMITLSNQNAAKAGVDNRVRFYGVTSSPPTSARRPS